MFTRMWFALSMAFWSTFQSAYAGSVFSPLGPDCGQWLQARQAKQSTVYEGYVVGMLTGKSMASGVSLWGSPSATLSQPKFSFG